MSLNVQFLLLIPVIAGIYCLIDVTILSKRLPRNIKSDGQTLNLQTTQREIRNRALVALIITLISFFKASDWFHINSNQPNHLSDAFKWLCLPVATLFFAVVNVGNRRFSSAKSITGKRTDELNVHHRYLANTLEQTVLFTLIHIIIAVAWSDNNQSNIGYIACNCCLFVSGRILFCRYTIWPNIPRKRAFGFGLTAYPTGVATIWCIFKLITTL